MKFKMEIELGNDAMRNGSDLATELELIAVRLRNMDAPVMPDNVYGRPLEHTLCQSIKDANGNRVGTWSIK